MGSDLLAGEIAVVTGAVQGIGEACARALADAGATVALTYRTVERAAAKAAEIGDRHAGFAMDVGSTASVDACAAAVAARLGEPTILVNSAGINRIGPAETFTDEDWAAVLDVNLTGTFRCCRAFGGRMLEQGRGAIVNVGSIMANVAMPGRAPYSASKGAIVALTRTLAVEWAGRGVRVNALLPGPVRTPMVVDAIARGIVDEQRVVDHEPMGRLAEPEDIGAAAVLLCSPLAGFVTGQALTVDGGYTSWGDAGPASRLPRHGGVDA